MSEAPEIPNETERRIARERAGQPGVWSFERHERPNDDGTVLVREYINVPNCPCGCGRELSVRLVRENKVANDHTWLWNGDEVNPTLQPSIRRLHGCKWHGFLTAGRWTHCADGAPCAPDCYVSPTTPPVPPPAAPRAVVQRNSANPAHRYAPPVGAPQQPPHAVLPRSHHVARAARINERLRRR